MSKKWEAVANSTEYKNLTSHSQKEVQDEYFNNVIVPSIDSNDIESARKDFDRHVKKASKPKAEVIKFPEPKPPEPSPVWDEIKTILSDQSTLMTKNIEYQDKNITLLKEIAVKPEPQPKLMTAQATKPIKQPEPAKKKFYIEVERNAAGFTKGFVVTEL